MLQNIRENVTGWVAWLIIILLTIPFAFWGINQYFDTNAPQVAAEVNGTEISVRAVEQAYQQRYNELAEMLGEQMSPDLINAQALRMDVLQQMIMRELIQQKVQEQGYRPSLEALRAHIRGMQAFQVEGEFSPTQYRQTLNYSNVTPAAFEQAQRRNLSLEQMQRAMTGSSFATPVEAAFQVALREQGRIHSDVMVPASRFLDSVEVSDEEIATYYEENTGSFLTEESADVAYVVLDKQDFAADEEVSEQQLRDFYQRQLDQYASQEQRRASHILIEGGDEESLQKAQEIHKRITEGESFAKLAEEFSADTISAEEGGDLGLVQRGQLVGNFEDALFSMEEGEVSEPVKTEFGYHIIKLDEIKAPAAPEFEEVRDELVADYKKQAAEQEFQDAVQQLTDITYADSGSLASAADELGLEIKTIESVTRRNGEGLAANDKVRNAVFSATVLQDRMNSDPITLDDGRVVVLRIAEHHPAEPKPLVTVADDIREILKRQKASEDAKALAESIQERAAAGENLAAIATDLNLPFRGERKTLRSSSTLSTNYTSALFAAEYPGENPVIDQTQVNGTDFVVFRLTAVEPGRFAELTNSEQQSRIQQLASRTTNVELQAYMRELRDSADVQVFEKNLEQ